MLCSLLQAFQVHLAVQIGGSMGALRIVLEMRFSQILNEMKSFDAVFIVKYGLF